MSAIIKLKTLQGHLESLNGFADPKLKYEQYETPAHLAAYALYTIQVRNLRIFALLLNQLISSLMIVHC